MHRNWCNQNKSHALETKKIYPHECKSNVLQTLSAGLIKNAAFLQSNLKRFQTYSGIFSVIVSVQKEKIITWKAQGVPQ